MKADACWHDSVDVKHDVIQVRELKGWMDEETFLPLHGDEVTDRSLAQCVINYFELANDIKDKLK